jgi:hypothetical protein
MTIDLTQIIIAIVGGLFSVVGLVATYWIQSRMADKKAAATITAAVTNSLGAAQQAVDGVLTAADPTIKLPPTIPASLVVPTQYVLNHAGPELARFGITPEAVADKVNAQIGLSKLKVAAAVEVASVVPTPAPIPLLGAPS